MKLFSAFAISALAGNACAHSSFNLFVGPQPYYVPAPMPIIPAPSVGFSMGIPLGDPCDGAPTLGLSVDVPLVQPAPIVQPVIRTRPVMVTRMAQPVYIDSVCRDSEDRRYWRIYNNTDSSIQVMSKTESKVIEPGQSRKLDHSSSFTLKVTDGDQKIRVRTTHHTLSIQYDQEDALKVCRA